MKLLCLSAASSETPTAAASSKTPSATSPASASRRSVAASTAWRAIAATSTTEASSHVTTAATAAATSTASTAAHIWALRQRRQLFARFNSNARLARRRLFGLGGEFVHELGWHVEHRRHVILTQSQSAKLQVAFVHALTQKVPDIRRRSNLHVARLEYHRRLSRMRREKRTLTQFAMSGKLCDGHRQHFHGIPAFFAVTILAFEQVPGDIHEELRRALVHFADLLTRNLTRRLGHLGRLRRTDANEFESTLAFDVWHSPLRTRSAERYGDSCGSRAPGSSRTVNVRLRILWWFALNHELDAGNVQTTRRDISGN
mmetsp:Transcript_2682/g.9642  ORF Transcript_2682/g.9642 Transcript_2682/m.9642 type:complete len:315 (+) Transcript_2682:1771-2715(+)